MSAAGSAASWAALAPDLAARYGVDGRQPAWHARPASPEALAATLREACATGLAVMPRGAGAQMGLGAPPARADLVVETGALTGIVQYRPEDLTAVALAGTPLTSLQEIFARRGQWLALDPAHAERVTLGGALATNAAGPHRLRYGTARNMVLGMQVAYPDGRLARSGARVVKSVAGYNMHALHIGALGTLGVITEVAVRLHPLPVTSSLLVCPLTVPEGGADLVRRLVRQPLGLGALEWLNAVAATCALRTADLVLPLRASALLLVLCEGPARVVARQEQEAYRAAQAAGCEAPEQLRGTTATALLRAARGILETPDDVLLLKLGVPPADTIAAAAALEAALPSSEISARLVAHAGSGIVRALLSGPDWSYVAAVRTTRELAHSLGGHLIVERCPMPAKGNVDVWGPALAPALMRRVKAALDPHNTLNPGRYAGGI